jgi:hypothetical protein
MEPCPRADLTYGNFLFGGKKHLLMKRCWSQIQITRCLTQNQCLSGPVMEPGYWWSWSWDHTSSDKNLGSFSTLDSTVVLCHWNVSGFACSKFRCQDFCQTCVVVALILTLYKSHLI